MNDNFNLDESIISMKFKIVVIGDVSVGKSSLVTRLSTNYFKDGYEASIGVDFSNKNIKFKEKLLKLQLWDTAGQEKFKSLIPSYVRNANLIYLVFDLSNRTSFININKWISFLEETVQTQIPIILIGNKLDLVNKQVVVSDEEIDHIEKSFNIKCFKISVKTSENVNNFFYNSIVKLDIFDGFIGDNNDLVKVLEESNKEENSFVTLDNHENTFRFNVNTPKSKNIKDNENEENFEEKVEGGDKEMSFNFSNNRLPNIKIRKRCNC